MRASLLASAMASLCRCKRPDAVLSHAPKLNRDQVCGRIRRTLAAWTSNMRKYRLPRLEIRPRIERPPVLYCRGTRPSQAPRSRPRSNASPVPIAATRAVEISGPIPVDVPRFSREALGHSATVFSNRAGLVKSRAEWRRTGL